jgi:hypothetical protein
LGAVWANAKVARKVMAVSLRAKLGVRLWVRFRENFGADFRWNLDRLVCNGPHGIMGALQRRILGLHREKSNHNNTTVVKKPNSATAGMTIFSL